MSTKSTTQSKPAFRSSGLAACLALPATLLLASVGALAADAAFVASYHEVRSSAVGEARAVLQQQAASERTSASSAGGSAHVHVLQEIDRLERWVLLEWTEGVPQPDSVEATGTVGALTELLQAPPDVRHNHLLPGSTPGADQRMVTPARAFYEVTHLDIGAGANQTGIIQALGQLLLAARAAQGNLRAEAWQQNAHANHYEMVFVWGTRAQRQAFAASPSVRQFRAGVAPVLGSPYDDRFYRLVE